MDMGLFFLVVACAASSFALADWDVIFEVLRKIFSG